MDGETRNFFIYIHTHTHTRRTIVLENILYRFFRVEKGYDNDTIEKARLCVKNGCERKLKFLRHLDELERISKKKGGGEIKFSCTGKVFVYSIQRF